MMDRDSSFQSVGEAEELEPEAAESMCTCQGTWQRVRRSRWRDHLLSWFGWYPWQCMQCLACAYYRYR